MGWEGRDGGWEVQEGSATLPPPSTLFCASLRRQKLVQLWPELIVLAEAAANHPAVKRAREDTPKLKAKRPQQS